MPLESASVKAICRKFMKLSPGVDLTNVLHTAFTHADPKSTKDTDDLTAIFVPWRSVRVGEIDTSIPRRSRWCIYVALKLAKIQTFYSSTLLQTYTEVLL